ncbi:MAG: MarR family transcriptional regulator [Pseudomonadota bacterium]
MVCVKTAGARAPSAEAASATQEAPAPYVLDEQVGYLLRLANQRHAAIFQAGAPPDLTPTQFSALIRLGEHGQCSQNQLGRLASMDIATIKGVVDRLRRKGLVAVAPSDEDRRRSMIALTDAGQALVDGLAAEGRAITRETLAPLSAAEQRTFLALLRKLT